MEIKFITGTHAEIMLAKKTRKVEVDVARLPASIVEDIFLYGLQQKLADAGASFEHADDKVTKALGCLDRLYAGEWSKRKESIGGASPLETLARQLCAKLAAKKVCPKGKPTEMEQTRILEIVETNWVKFQDQAEKIIAERDAAAAIDLDM